MKVCIVGAGKLGLPVAVALATKFDVNVHDVNQDLCRHRKYEHQEEGRDGRSFQELFDRACSPTGSLSFNQSLPDAVRGTEVIFVAVQTPHHPDLDGSKWVSGPRTDFDYSFLKAACRQLAGVVKENQTVAVISTVLPGTMRWEILPILWNKCRVVYNPFFIAMGTVVRDFMNPEFVLLGGDGEDGIRTMMQFYHDFYGEKPSPILEMSYDSAEMVKVCYNTFISQKIVFANTVMELCHKTPNANCDDVVGALTFATDRIVSSKYMRGGMGDGGGCHPRDAIAMSWMAGQKFLSYNLFEEIGVRARQCQAEWLARLFRKEAGNLPMVILGKAFKPGTAITAGSPALLVADILRGWGDHFWHHDPFVDGCEWKPETYPDMVKPHAYLIATKHEVFRLASFPKGSVVVDPFRHIPPRDGVKVIHVGKGV